MGFASSPRRATQRNGTQLAIRLGHSISTNSTTTLTTCELQPRVKGCKLIGFESESLPNTLMTTMSSPCFRSHSRASTLTFALSLSLSLPHLRLVHRSASQPSDQLPSEFIDRTLEVPNASGDFNAKSRSAYVSQPALVCYQTSPPLPHPLPNNLSGRPSNSLASNTDRTPEVASGLSDRQTDWPASPR